MNIIYSRTPLRQSIFLAGPTPRSPDVASWRPGALMFLQSMGFEGDVHVPEDADWSPRFTYDDQVDWELQALHASTVVLFWVPRSLPDMPAFTTNVEFGFFAARRNVVCGLPANCEKMKYLRALATLHGHPIYDDLPATCAAAIELAKRPFQTSRS